MCICQETTGGCHFLAKVVTGLAVFDEFDETCRQIEVLVSGIKAMTAEHSVNSCKWSIDDSFAGNGCLYFSRRITQGAVGVKCNLLDAEDYGAPQFYTGKHKEEFWCLGSQYWARNPHVQGYNARFGILLDMVGGEGSVFMKEGYSEEFAPDINKKVWKAAKKAGYGKTFMDGNGGFVTDDHLFINRLARIKTIDIIPYNQEGDFTPTWHTVNDNMKHIDKNTLKAVGQTVLEVIYNEK